MNRFAMSPKYVLKVRANILLRLCLLHLTNRTLRGVNVKNVLLADVSVRVSRVSVLFLPLCVALNCVGIIQVDDPDSFRVVHQVFKTNITMNNVVLMEKA